MTDPKEVKPPTFRSPGSAESVPEGQGEHQFQLLVASVTDYAICLLDVSGHVQTWNAGAQRITGYVADEIVGRHFSQFYTEADRETGEPQRALDTARNEGRFEHEAWRLRKDGSRFWASVIIDPVYDENGTLIGFAKITRDMTERHQAAERLAESERQFRILVEGVVDYALYMLDPTGRITNWNTGAERIKGYKAEEVIGQHFSKFYTDEDREAGIPAYALATAVREGKYEKEGWRVRKDGSRFWASVVIDPIRDENGTLIGFAKITRDITERAEAQRALDQAREALHQAQKLEAIGQLTGGVAHDFNNLLTVVTGSLDLILREAADRTTPRIRRLAENAMRAADRGAKLTQQLLAFSRRQALSPETVIPNDLILEFQGMVQRACGESVQVRLDLDPNLWASRIDATHFETALLNLAVNSRDAMPRGGVLTIMSRNADLSRADVARIPDLEPGPYVRISVCDTGHGMPQDVLEHATEPFFTTKGVGQGSGLGLSQVYGFARQSDGQIVIESEPGLGTKVHLYLPRSDEPPQRPAERPVSSAEARGRGTVLVVEDSPDVLDVTVESLKELGYSVVTAADGVEARAILEGPSRIDVLLTDVVMPNGVNGIDLARQARRLRPGLRIILTSGYADAILKQQGITSEFPFLAKPFRQAELAQKLRDAASRAELADQRTS